MQQAILPQPHTTRDGLRIVVPLDPLALVLVEVRPHHFLLTDAPTIRATENRVAMAARRRR